MGSALALDPDDLRRHQQQRLDALVAYAVAHSPFYRRLYQGIDTAVADLAILPPVTRAQLMAGFDDWVTDSRLSLPDLERHAQGLAGDALHLGHYRVMATSGSTGGRGVFVYSRADWRVHLANIARADEQRLGRLELRPTTVATVSEVRTPGMGEAMRAAWGVEPFNWYGLTEGGVLACDCSSHQGMHLFEDLFIVENVDVLGRPVPDGVVGHKLLVTNLFNRTQPLIRYELSDMVALDSSPCACGRTLRRVTSIEGRSDDIVSLPAAAGGRVAVPPFTLRSPFARLPQVRQYRVVAGYDGVNVLVVARPGTDPVQVAGEVRSAMAAALAGAGAAAAVAVQMVESLDRDGGHGAKFKLVESRVPVS